MKTEKQDNTSPFSYLTPLRGIEPWFAVRVCTSFDFVESWLSLAVKPQVNLDFARLHKIWLRRILAALAVKPQVNLAFARLHKISTFRADTSVCPYIAHREKPRICHSEQSEESQLTFHFNPTSWN